MEADPDHHFLLIFLTHFLSSYESFILIKKIKLDGKTVKVALRLTDFVLVQAKEKYVCVGPRQNEANLNPGFSQYSKSNEECGRSKIIGSK